MKVLRIWITRTGLNDGLMEKQLGIKILPMKDFWNIFLKKRNEYLFRFVEKRSIWYGKFFNSF